MLPHNRQVGESVDFLLYGVHISADALFIDNGNPYAHIVPDGDHFRVHGLAAADALSVVNIREHDYSLLPRMRRSVRAALPPSGVEKRPFVLCRLPVHRTEHHIENHTVQGGLDKQKEVLLYAGYRTVCRLLYETYTSFQLFE